MQYIPTQREARPQEAVVMLELLLLLPLLTRVTVKRLESEKSDKVSFWVSISLTGEFYPGNS